MVLRLRSRPFLGASRHVLASFGVRNCASSIYKCCLHPKSTVVDSGCGASAFSLGNSGVQGRTASTCRCQAAQLVRGMHMGGSFCIGGWCCCHVSHYHDTMQAANALVLLLLKKYCRCLQDQQISLVHDTGLCMLLQRLVCCGHCC